MSGKEIMGSEEFEKLLKIIEPYVKNKEALSTANAETTFLKDLQVSSSRLVDIILAIEDNFNIEVTDSEADKILTVGAAVDLIRAKAA